MVTLGPVFPIIPLCPTMGQRRHTLPDSTGRRPTGGPDIFFQYGRYFPRAGGVIRKSRTWRRDLRGPDVVRANGKRMGDLHPS